MSVLFPRFHEFSPFFRLADELDRASRSLEQHTTNVRSFAPRFDVKETPEAFELHGELPGVEQSNVNIEWTDDNTITISGHTESRYESGGPEVDEVEGTPEAGKSKHHHAYHKPTVEEEGAEASGSKSAAKPTSTAVTKTEGEKSVSKGDRPRFWVTERSYGSFNRTFQFPSRVDHDAVKASMKNGVLSIIVPKAKAKEPRKITIS